MTRNRLLSLAIGAALTLTAGTASAQAPPPPPAYGPPITLEQAKKVMAGAEAESKKNNLGMVITILDSGGRVVMLQRMDGAQLGSIEVARDKAWSAVAFRRPTKVFEDAVGQGGGNLRLLRLTGARLIVGEDGLEAVAAEARIPPGRDAILVAGEDPEAQRAQVDGIRFSQVPVERVGVGVEGGRERVEEVELGHAPQLTIAWVRSMFARSPARHGR